jgi:hypothetical protein
MLSQGSVAQEATHLMNRAGYQQDSPGVIAQKAAVLGWVLKKMFNSSQYFKGKSQIDSYPTAVDAAREARDKLLAQEASRPTTYDTSDLNAQEAKGEFIQNSVGAALMVFWCAHGLTGSSQLEAADKVFSYTIVSPRTLNDWDKFRNVLGREAQKRANDM